LNVNALAQQLDIKTISPEFFVKEVNRTGQLNFKRTLNLSFKTAGYLAKVNVDEGDSFVKGQILAKLDTFQLIAEKNSRYASLLQAKKDVRRIEALLVKKLSSQQALDVAKTLIETTRASYKQAQYNVEKAQLIAPFEGVVTARFSELNELQNPNQAALQIAAINNNLVVRVGLTVEEVSLVKINQQVQVSLLHEVLTGTVSKIPILGNSQSRLYTVEILFVEQYVKEITVGQIVKVAFLLANNTSVYRLPISALNRVDEQGNALITLQLNNKKNYQQKAFAIEEFSNDYIYLKTQQGALPLTVITQGWQQLNFLKKEDEITVKYELKK